MSYEDPSAGKSPVSERSAKPVVSVVIPVRNAASCLQRCLEAVAASTYSRFEIIVVDDGSTDSTPSIAERFGAVCLATGGTLGPAAARNRGAKRAQGEILLFVDADVVVRRDALEIVAEAFSKDPQLAALFGSYDDAPPCNNIVSQYKNLLHHYIHQISNPDATTFWTGLGAIRRSVFMATGGFNEKRYRRPSIEDVELGYRLRQAGHKILLDKRLRGKHLKRWNLLSLLGTDILCRAIPWSFLILETRNLPKDLNFRFSHRLSSLLVGLLVPMPFVLLLPYRTFRGAPILPVILLAWFCLLSCTVFLNRQVYQLFARRGGYFFAMAGMILHLFYYFYSGLVFALCCGVHWSRALRLGLRTSAGLNGGRPGN